MPSTVPTADSAEVPATAEASVTSSGNVTAEVSATVAPAYGPEEESKGRVSKMYVDDLTKIMWARKTLAALHRIAFTAARKRPGRGQRL